MICWCFVVFQISEKGLVVGWIKHLIVKKKRCHLEITAQVKNTPLWPSPNLIEGMSNAFGHPKMPTQGL